MKQIIKKAISLFPSRARIKFIYKIAGMLGYPIPYGFPYPDCPGGGFVTYAYFPHNNTTLETDDYLINLMQKALPLIQACTFSFSDRPKLQAKVWLETWPGEHYKLLATLVNILQPKQIMEIGTYTGMSSMAKKDFLQKDGTIYTYDIIPWDKIQCDSWQKILCTSDFDEQLSQKVLDLTNPKVQQNEMQLWENTELIFIDAAKDGLMEYIFCDFLDKIQFKKPPLVVFDDIKLMNMVNIWDSIKHPKLDITSFGHWSGTGIVYWI